MFINSIFSLFSLFSFVVIRALDQLIQIDCSFHPWHQFRNLCGTLNLASLKNSSYRVLDTPSLNFSIQLLLYLLHFPWIHLNFDIPSVIYLELFRTMQSSHFLLTWLRHDWYLWIHFLQQIAADTHSTCVLQGLALWHLQLNRTCLPREASGEDLRSLIERIDPASFSIQHSLRVTSD